MRVWDGRWSRREALRWGAGATVLGGVVVGGCAGAAGQSETSAAPTAAAQGVQVIFQPNCQGVSYNKTVHDLFQAYVDQNFNANPKYKGIHAVVSGSLGQGQTGPQIAAAIAGSGYADVVEGCCSDYSTYQSGGWLLPLTDYLRRDNVDTSIWSKRHVDVLTDQGQVMAAPSYDGPAVVMYRQDLLDTLGLPYPDPTWDYKQAQDIWTRAAGTDPKTNKARYGISLMISSGDYYQKLNYFLKGFGADEANATLDQCTIDSPAAAKCLTYIVDMVKAKVATSRHEESAVADGSAVFSMCLGRAVFPSAQVLGTKYKWDILPVPTWPNGFSTYNNIDFYGIFKTTQHPDECWQLVHWLTAMPDWQRFQIKTTLVQPCLLTLWDEWETTVKSVAPPLAGKQLHYYKDAALSQGAWPAVFFRYDTPQANSIINQWGDQIWNSKVSVEEGLQQMQAQVNALEALGPVEAAKTQAAVKRFPTDGPEIAAMPTGI